MTSALKYTTDFKVTEYCRELFYSFISVFSETILPFLGTLTLLNILPAFLYGCSVPEPLQASPTGSGFTVGLLGSQDKIEELDIFVFRDDRLQKLDCYQKIPDPVVWNKEVVSGYGDRLIAVCVNSGKEIMEWTDISSLSSLRSHRMSLEDEIPGYPFMCGMQKISTGKEGRYKDMTVSPLSGEIQLRSICCDFSDKPYAGARLTDAKAYLTNVSAECGYFDEKGILPTRIINSGGLCEEELKAMRDASMLYGEFPKEIGRDVQFPGFTFRCYPNNSITESPGTPFTRLVIEGNILGQTYYWPIDINRENGGNGICRNEKYIYDIRITRKGSTDPDIPVRTEDIDIRFEVRKWEEQEGYEVRF